MARDPAENQEGEKIEVIRGTCIFCRRENVPLVGKLKSFCVACLRESGDRTDRLWEEGQDRVRKIVREEDA